MEDSAVNLVFLANIIGKNARVFSSSPTHAMKREGEEITKEILVSILKIISNNDGDSHNREEV